MQKTAIITGGAKGIGRAVSLAFARAGYAVAVLYHTSEAAAEALVQEIETDGGRAAAIPCDVRDSASVQNAVDAVHKHLGKVDVLVNNAGISEQILFTDITDEKWADMLAVHLTGAFYMTRAVLPDMLHQKAGRIVNIASMWGETGGSCEVHYSAAKAGHRAVQTDLCPLLHIVEHVLQIRIHFFDGVGVAGVERHGNHRSDLRQVHRNHAVIVSYFSRI